MKKQIIYILTVLLISALSVNHAEAQIFKKLRKKAQKSLEKKVENKVDQGIEKATSKMVDDSWDAVFGGMDLSGKPGAHLPFAAGNNIATEDSYHFKMVTTTHIQTISDDGEFKPPVTMKMYFNPVKKYTGSSFNSPKMEKNANMTIIYDLKNKAMLMLLSSKGRKFSQVYQWTQPPAVNEDTTDSQKSDVNWDEIEEWHGYKKIGKKNISGYSCNGYENESEGRRTEVWVTRNVSAMKPMIEANANAKQLKGKIPEEYPFGMMMEMTSENLKTGAKTTMRVTKIDNNANVSFKMSDYPSIAALKK